MRLRLEIELPRLAHPPDLHVIVRVLPHRHRFIRNVRNPCQQQPELVVNLLDILVQPRNPVTQLPDLLLLLRGIDSLPFQLADLPARRILLRL